MHARSAGLNYVGQVASWWASSATRGLGSYGLKRCLTSAISHILQFTMLTGVVCVRRAVRDPANAPIVNADPELQQYVRNVKMSAEDMKAKMRNVAAGIFAAQVRIAHWSGIRPCAHHDLQTAVPMNMYRRRV